MENHRTRGGIAPPHFLRDFLAGEHGAICDEFGRTHENAQKPVDEPTLKKLRMFQELGDFTLEQMLKTEY